MSDDGTIGGSALRGGNFDLDEVVTRVQLAGAHLAVTKGAWYPSPALHLPDEDATAFTGRLMHSTHSPYDHRRYRSCAIGEHRSCTDRSSGPQRGCQCPCHADVGDDGLPKVPVAAVAALRPAYSLPDTTVRRVLGVALREQRAGRLRSLEDLRIALGHEYGSYVADGFVIDVAAMLEFGLRQGEEDEAVREQIRDWRLLAEAARIRYEVDGDTPMPGDPARPDRELPLVAPPVPEQNLDGRFGDLVPSGVLLGDYRARRDDTNDRNLSDFPFGLLFVGTGVASVVLGALEPRDLLSIAVGVALLLFGWVLLSLHAKASGRRAELENWRAALIASGVPADAVDAPADHGHPEDGHPEDDDPEDDRHGHDRHERVDGRDGDNDTLAPGELDFLVFHDERHRDGQDQDEQGDERTGERA
ncbi:SoxR reducing system RseC family protein [Saccharothrix sp. HUAS TT1]|uniref:SoxR reducing system RseC family protein n=1 Tax=unclassified Saccharothrix TaxID=2593673 RepID=UPI00345BCFD4